MGLAGHAYQELSSQPKMNLLQAMWRTAWPMAAPTGRDPAWLRVRADGGVWPYSLGLTCACRGTHCASQRPTCASQGCRFLVCSGAILIAGRVCRRTGPAT